MVCMQKQAFKWALWSVENPQSFQWGNTQFILIRTHEAGNEQLGEKSEIERAKNKWGGGRRDCSAGTFYKKTPNCFLPILFMAESALVTRKPFRHLFLAQCQWLTNLKYICCETVYKVCYPPHTPTPQPGSSNEFSSLPSFWAKKIRAEFCSLLKDVSRAPLTYVSLHWHRSLLSSAVLIRGENCQVHEANATGPRSAVPPPGRITVVWNLYRRHWQGSKVYMFKLPSTGISTLWCVRDHRDVKEKWVTDEIKKILVDRWKTVSLM